MRDRPQGIRALTEVNEVRPRLKASPDALLADKEREDAAGRVEVRILLPEAEEALIRPVSKSSMSVISKRTYRPARTSSRRRAW